MVETKICHTFSVKVIKHYLDTGNKKTSSSTSNEIKKKPFSNENKNYDCTCTCTFEADGAECSITGRATGGLPPIRRAPKVSSFIIAAPTLIDM